MNLYNKYSFLISEKLSGYKKEKKKFHEKTGYHLDLKQPTTFCEKLMYKKIYDRNPLLHITADKYMVRNYIEEIIGKEKAKEILIPLLHVTQDPATIPFYDLPESYIVKANHGSGWNIVIDGSNVEPEEIISSCKHWLKSPYGYFKHEWAYQHIKRKIIVEKIIKDENGNIPIDYKFYIFHGKCKLVHVDFDRFYDHSRSLFEPVQFEIMPVQYKFKRGYNISKPLNYKSMLNLAEQLGQHFDFVRIDLYNINGKVYFGEFTHYPESGMGKFEPKSFDYQLGSYWKLDPNYWK